MTAAVTLADLRTYLGAGSTQWSDGELTDVLAVETRQQSTKCRVPTGVVEDLDEALCRRVARNLAMRKVPLGLVAGEVESARVPATDPEIKRLEAPYRRRVVA